jgi:lipopolysaccharide transport system ATP-binding protein
MTDVAITADGLAKRYRIGEYHASYGTLRDSLVGAVKKVGRRHHGQRRHEEIWALDGVSFELVEGEVLGLIGGNGAGKSTLLRILTRITSPTLGSAEIRGRVGSLLEVGTGFHPELTGRENVYLNGAILGMKRREISAKLDEIVEFAGVERFVDTPVKRYSSGMYVRLAFSVAAHLEPEILLVDEVLAVGDAEFQRRCLGRMESLGESGRTVIFVSHNMQTVAQLCDRAILLERGQVVLDGDSTDVVARYLQSGLGSGSHRTWPDDLSAPGDDLVRLRWARVVGEDGEPLDAVDVRRPVGVQIAFRVLRQGVPVMPKFKLVDKRGDVAFNAFDTASRWHEPTAPGEYVSTAWIPGNLLNEGLYSADIAVASISAAKLHHHFQERAVVAFHVQDPAEGDSARGIFTGQWRGVVRPLLDWTVGEVESDGPVGDDRTYPAPTEDP